MSIITVLRQMLKRKKKKTFLERPLKFSDMIIVEPVLGVVTSVTYTIDN